MPFLLIDMPPVERALELYGLSSPGACAAARRTLQRVVWFTARLCSILNFFVGFDRNPPLFQSPLVWYVSFENDLISGISALSVRYQDRSYRR
jgi:hypothetical protein